MCCETLRENFRILLGSDVRYWGHDTDSAYFERGDFPLITASKFSRSIAIFVGRALNTTLRPQETDSLLEVPFRNRLGGPESGFSQ